MSRVGIRKENRDAETRAPLTPEQVRWLIKREVLMVNLEGSEQRCFSDRDYRAAGARLSSDMSGCSVVFGLREVPLTSLLPQKTFCFFSRAADGKPQSRTLIERIVRLSGTLIDYEQVTDDRGLPLLGFEKFAGQAAALDSLWAFGVRAASAGLHTPFAELSPMSGYASLEEARTAVQAAGAKLASQGLPAGMSPWICAVYGEGLAAAGAEEMLTLLGCRSVPAVELQGPNGAALLSGGGLYTLTFTAAEAFVHVSGAPFDRDSFLSQPQDYRGAFAHYLPYFSVVINTEPWEPRFPRLVTVEALMNLRRADRPKLRVLADAHGQAQGAIEFAMKTSTPATPTYVFQPMAAHKVVDGCLGQGPIIWAVERLAELLPRLATESFGELLAPYVSDLARAEYQGTFDSLQLPPEIKRGIIIHDGRLTEPYHHLEELVGS